ncbi:scavenger receptor class B member 1 isoform X1 [Lucilia cuprina]|uniref:scavenger receptor class B member 1 isoform X1 n=2 Tax=Lucilia cuprina TaxID=7375 RepID=UPI001F06AF1A|nr:scavenger receptor class B member 1 isoform X1 [Lucilia cuprina]
MKEFGKFFSRRYSAVNCEDNNTHQQVTVVAGLQNVTTNTQLERHKSLQAQRSMNPAGILKSFFNERKKNHRARSPTCAFLLLAVGILAICTAVLVKIFHPYDLIFNWKLVMAENGEIFNLWAKPPVDLYIKVYLFNITNAEAFLAGREKMNVEQVGPYVYKELMTHENITFNDNNTISTNPSHPLVWQEHLSEGRREDDEVVMVNIAMLAISHLTADKSFFVRIGLNSLFMTQNSQPIVRMTAREFMFGYATTLTTLGNKFLPNWIHFDKVGLIDRMYDFDNDFETFHTGVPNANVSGLYATYMGKKDLTHWKGDHCSNIEMASDGVKFPSFIQPNDSIKFFRKSMCRPINLHRSGEERVSVGSLSGYKYIFEENALDNGRINPENKCFCRHGYCQPHGLIDVTDCYYGFPISLSLPHFMDADPGLQENVTGLTPDKEKHSSEFIVQPESGLPLSLSVKVQINMHFRDLSAYSRVKRFSHLTVPMLWFEIMMPKLPESLDNRFNFYLNYLPYIEPLGFWGGLLAGLTLLIYAITRATLKMSSLAKKSHLLELNYGRANLIQANQNGVYKPCELKLLEKNEKSNIILSNANETSNLYTELQPTYKKQPNNLHAKRGSFALELEPALGSSSDSSSCDEGNDSDTATLTLSRNSSSSCCQGNNNCCVDELKTDNSSNSNTTSDEDDDNDDVEEQQQIALSTNSSGYRTSTSESMNSMVTPNLNTPMIITATSIQK